ncbi:hypothetical protein HMPREF1495_1216 [Lachnoanaerobaculum sp. MSX33]|nr:hypothetical protein HMPREF1495_1216 [Lachnoanaerobaculum sp. MSX33]
MWASLFYYFTITIWTLSFRHYCDIIKAVLSIKIEGIA